MCIYRPRLFIRLGYIRIAVLCPDILNGSVAFTDRLPGDDALLLLWDRIYFDQLRNREMAQDLQDSKSHRISV